ncbi:MAG TPA: L,D-transpeptidase family protein [Chthoniobacteraceae bacterium]|jgi:L,D-peptidoglycan transpeptidase YkuD (ErfK/YbiS/YcfS/YnhG family)
MKPTATGRPFFFSWILRTLGVTWALLLALGIPGESAVAQGLEPGVQQLIVSVAPDWNSTTGRLQRFERSGREWKPVGDAWPVLYGRSGLAWGRGVLGTGEAGLRKVERDWRAPAGVFRIGKIYTYDRALPAGAKFPFHTVTTGDAWVDDVNSPHYNQHISVDAGNPPPWFEKQKMRHNDFAYRWLVEIRHNSDPVVPGAGSAIFFHIRRGTQKPSAGCTTMAEEKLVEMIRWLRAEGRPHYALLPADEYTRKWQAWGLPSPDAAAALLP